PKGTRLCRGCLLPETYHQRGCEPGDGGRSRKIDGRGCLGKGGPITFKRKEPMAQYTRTQVAQAMRETGLVPLFLHRDIELGKKVMKAWYEWGVRLMEFAAREDFAHEVFGELNTYALKELPGLMMGVGCVTDAASASLYMAPGANFVVTPVLMEDNAIACN